MNETRTRNTARPYDSPTLPYEGPRAAEAKPSLTLRNTVFRMGVIVLMLVIFLAIRHLKGVVWPQGGHPAHNPFDQIVA